MQSLPPALAPLGAWPQFVTWVALPEKDKPGKLTKLPTHWRAPVGAKLDELVVDAHAPGVWGTFEQCAAAAPLQNRGHGSGVGFVFTDQDPFFFLDIDGAYDRETTAWSPLAHELCGRLGGAAVETSMSGVGLHIIGRTYKPLEHAKKNTLLGLELYTSRRFVALTGANALGDAALDCGASLVQIIADYFQPTVSGDHHEWTAQAAPGYTGPEDDEALLSRIMAASARSAAGAFGGDVTFSDLWTGNADALGRKWPSNKSSEAWDASSADMALANQLAFWTGKNCERMRALMERSALKREKWFTRPSYLADTIVQACKFTREVYSQAPSAPMSEPAVLPPAPEVLAAAAEATGRSLRDPLSEYMAPDVQLEHFRDCWYDNTTDRVYSLRHNTVFSRLTFNVNFGGHVFVIDPQGRKLSDSAWDALTLSRVNLPPIVDGLCFRPEHEPGAIIQNGRRRYVNSYVPHEPRLVDGDPGKFLEHMRKLLPDDRDRELLVSWMASAIQNPGRKFQWWPVVQGAEGNGKSLLLLIMTHAFGEEYTHVPNAIAMARDGLKFNSWIYRKLFVGVEEIMLAKKRDFLEEFKLIVTGERIPVEKKGQDQFTGDNRANGIFFTNHADGVPVTTDTRRYAIFYCAQQELDPWQVRDGMDETYFEDLVDWIKGRGKYARLGADYGAAVTVNYLRNLELKAEYDPARLCTRAPKTTATELAVRLSLGACEQEILEAIEEGRPGFAGGWVSSKALDTLIEQKRFNLPRSRRRAAMRQLGYDYHPALVDGRVHDPVMPDAGRPRLYVKAGHLALNITKPSDIGRAYTKAQERATAGTLPFTVDAAVT